MAEVHVNTAGGEYSIYIGRGVLKQGLPGGLAEMRPRGIVLVSHPSLMELHGERVRSALGRVGESGYAIHEYLFPQGEENKNMETLERGYRHFLELGVTREDILLACGGGVVGDLAGFLAATYMRGIRYVQIPTTLMAMVDSAIGGKVGVDLPGAKNAVGAFHQPRAVYGDISFLDTLPGREICGGLAEMVKYGLLYDGKLLETVEKWEGRLAQDDSDLTSAIASCAGHKARVVSADERDLSGERAMLNYGHTFGHAVESACGYGELRHGEAVAVGMIMAARLAELTALSGEGLFAYHRRVLLPLLHGARGITGVDSGRIIADMQADKKKGRGLRFVLLEGPQSPRLVEDAKEKDIVAAVDETLQMLREEEIWR